MDSNSKFSLEGNYPIIVVFKIGSFWVNISMLNIVWLWIIYLCSDCDRFQLFRDLFGSKRPSSFYTENIRVLGQSQREQNRAYKTVSQIFIK